MTFKSYYGSTIREALNNARRELGADASVLASRQVDPSEGLPGACEVVCGLLEPGVGRRPSAPATAAKADGGTGKNLSESSPARVEAGGTTFGPTGSEPRQASGLSQFRKHVKTIRAAIGTSAPEWNDDDLRRELLMTGFGEDLCTEILSGIRQRLREAQRNGAAGSLESALADELSARLLLEPSLGRDRALRRITALVGPPGAGKTSMLVKLAVRYGLTGRRPVRLISLDGARPGGADALRSYAAAMAVPIDVIETGASLTQALESHENAGLILIDTPGLVAADLPAASDWMPALLRHPEIDVQVVIAASMSPLDMRASFAHFRGLLPSRIIVTQTDSAVSCRAAVGLALSSDRPISFVGTGQQIPEDLEEASAAALLRRRENERGRNAVSAA